MKKLKALLLILAIFTGAVLVPTMPSEAKTKKNSQETGLESEVICGFEDFREIIRTVLMGGNKGEISTDSTYVTEGNNCFRLCPQLDEIEEGQYYPDIDLRFTPKQTYFKNVEYVSIDVYNAKDCEFTAMLSTAYKSERYTIKPGANTLWFYIDRGVIDYYSGGAISTFRLYFQGGSKEMGPVDMYIDNFRRYYAKDNTFETYENNFEQNVWYPLEKDGETQNFTYWGVSTSRFTEPVFSINHDIEYIKTGTGSLKVEFLNAPNGKPGVRMFRTSDNQLGDLNQYAQNVEDYYIGFPIYNASDYEIIVNVSVFSNYHDENIQITTTIMPGCWSDADFVMPLKTLDESFSGDGFDIKTIGFEVLGMSDPGSIYLDSIGVYSYE